VVREFESNANRAAEPAAPVYDRDGDNAAWEAKLAEAAIEAEAQKARQQPDASAARETRAGAGEPSSGSKNSPELWNELSAWSTDARPTRVDEIEVPQDAHDADMPADQVAHDIFDGIEEALHTGTRAAAGAANYLAKAVQNVLGGIFSFFGGAEPKLTPMQAELAARANEELAEARAQAAAAQEKEADQDERIFNQDRQQQQDDFAARYGVPGGSSGRDRVRDDDYDRGREREI
jgi:hypothetical protein